MPFDDLSYSEIYARGFFGGDTGFKLISCALFDMGERISNPKILGVNVTMFLGDRELLIARMAATAAPLALLA